MGIGMSVIAILLLIMGVFENILPAFFVYIALGIILADVVIIIVLGNTICRRWQIPICQNDNRQEIWYFCNKGIHISLIIPINLWN